MPWNVDYYPNVPFVTPISVGKSKYTGRTQPLEMRCETSEGHADYIVKLWGSIELGLGRHCLAREVYGSLLADFFGLHTPEIAIVNIEPDFPISQPNPQIQSRLNQSLGLNFGSRLLTGVPIFSNPVPPSRKSDAASVYCFDMLIANMDRCARKPNVFHTCEGFILFDHEQAFPFSRPSTILGGCPDPWDFIKESWHQNHIFYPSIKGEDCSLEIEEFIMKLEALSDGNFAKIEEQIPDEWQTPDLKVLKDYLLNTRGNSQLFKRCLQEILA